MIPLVDQKKIIELLRSDLKKFAIMFFPHLMSSKTPEFHEEIYFLLQTEERVALAAPRGFAKSTLCCVIFPIWAAILMVRKDITIVSASETLATEFLRKIRVELETNESLRNIFKESQSDKWTENHIILSNGVNVRAKGAGGQIRGFRPDCIVLDDIETDESVTSEEQRKKLKEWLFKACLNTLLPGGQMIIAGTLIHPLSVLSDLIATPRQGWIRKKYRAYVDGIEKEGYELWPEGRPHSWLQQRKSEIGATAFASEFLNDPRLDDGVPVKEEDIKYYDSTLLPKQYSTVLAIDPAYSEDDRADFKVAMVVAIDANANRYCLDYVRTHVATGEFLDAALNLYIKHRQTMTAFGCPNSGTEKEFYRSLVNRANERKIYPPFVELKNTFVSAETGISTRNKTKRIIAALQPLFKQGKYFITAEQFEFREELLSIGYSRWDDLCDAATYCENLLTPVYFDANNKNETWDVEAAPVLQKGKSAGYGTEY